jgi:hypothetical protein
MSCSNCNKSNCSCSDNCPNKVSDITTFDCNSFNVIEVPCDASLCDVLGLLESYTTNMVQELSNMTSVSIESGNCIGLNPGTYSIQQVINAILAKLCACPLRALISLNQNGTLTANVSGGVAPYTYQWSIADTGQYIGFSGSTTTNTVTVVDIPTPPPNFTSGLVKVVVTDANGCSVNDVYLYYVSLID